MKTGNDADMTGWGPSAIQRATAMKRAAEEYINRNPKAFEAIVWMIEEEAACRRRVSVNGLTWELRDAGFAIKNDLTAAVSRIVAARYPNLRPYIEMRRCSLDSIEWGDDDGEG